MRKLPTASCSHCGNTSFDLRKYRSVMVLSPEIALFGLVCPTCGNDVAMLQQIPREMREELHFAAIEVGAGGLC